MFSLSVVTGGITDVSPLAPISANIFMCHFEKKRVLNNGARPFIWGQNVDYILFDSKNSSGGGGVGGGCLQTKTPNESLTSGKGITCLFHH